MTKTEFQRLCANRKRMVRVGGSQVYVTIAAREAERLHKALDGAVEVDTSGEGMYAFIRPAGTHR